MANYRRAIQLRPPLMLSISEAEIVAPRLYGGRIDATTAVVDDRYVNQTTDIDPDTGELTKRYSPDLIHELYTLKRVNGEWKVSAIFRQSIKPAES